MPSLAASCCCDSPHRVLRSSIHLPTLAATLLSKERNRFWPGLDFSANLRLFNGGIIVSLTEALLTSEKINESLIILTMKRYNLFTL
jgi:hypothetical protein